MNHLLGVTLLVLSALLFWAVRPRAGKEVRMVRLPGMWVILPMLIMLGLLSGGALVLTKIGG